jgi:hypothetical protein
MSSVCAKPVYIQDSLRLRGVSCVHVQSSTIIPGIIRFAIKLLKDQSVCKHLSLLETTSLDILGSDDGVKVNGTLGRGTDLGVGVAIELVALEDVEVDGVGPGDHEESERHDHGALSTDAVGNVTEDDWHHSASRHGRDEEGSTTLGVATETTEGGGEDDGEDAESMMLETGACRL